MQEKLEKLLIIFFSGIHGQKIYMEVHHFLPPKLTQDQNPSLQNRKPVKPEAEIKPDPEVKILQN